MTTVRKYTAEDKARAFQALIENMGSTYEAAEETGIPERTIQRWKYEFKPSTVLTRNEIDSAKKYRRLLYAQSAERLLRIVDTLLVKMELYPDTIVDHSLALARTLDRCIKAEQLAADNDFNLIILWEDHEGDVRATLYDHDGEEIPF